MKKFIVLSLVLLILSVSSLGVMADAVTGLDVSYSCLDNGNILVYAAVVNINDPVGLCGIGYDIEYDNSVLEIQNVEVNIPEKWQPFVESEMVENWSIQKSDNVYSWSLLNCEFGNGIKGDHELFVKIEFKPLTETKTTVKFKCENAVNDNVVEIEGESKNLEIDINGSNNNADNQESSVNTEGTQSSNTQSSVSVGTNNTETNSEHDITDVETPNDKTPDGKTPVAEDKTSDYVIIVIVILAIVAGAVVAFVLYSKKGKK